MRLVQNPGQVSALRLLVGIKPDTKRMRQHFDTLTADETAPVSPNQ